MGKKLYSLILFILVSVVSGLLVAGLAIPVIGFVTAAVKTGVELMESLPDELELPPQSQSSKLVFSDGTVFANFYNENRTYVPLDKIAPIMRKAQVAIEDHRFYEHGAFDPKGTLRALAKTASGSIQGGSTLTQQYVKMASMEKALQSGDKEALEAATRRSLGRKLQELSYAVELEKKLSKDEILERYLNIAYYGDGAYGVEAAAHHYFNTSSKKLTLSQAALLAGIVQNPSTYNPVSNTKAALQRRNLVLNRMQETGAITKDEAETAKKDTFDPKNVKYDLGGCANSKYPFICNYVERTLLDMPELGKNTEERKNLLYRGGLTIKVSINQHLQDTAQNTISSSISPKDPIIAVISSVEPSTGRIITMAQNRYEMGKEPGQTFFNYAVTKKMGGGNGFQAGSTFKPYVMAAALTKGIPPTRRYTANSPMNFGKDWFTSCTGRYRQGDWKVKNITKSGNMDMTYAVAWSVNTYFVQLARDTGICEVTTTAQKMGVELASSEDLVKIYQHVPSVAIGTAYITPLSNASGFSTFANAGKHCPPRIIDEITYPDGKKVQLKEATCEQAIAENVADTGAKILQSGFSSGYLGGLKFGGYQFAGKTGTTDDVRDLWFVGFTPELVTATMLSVDGVDPYWKGKKPNMNKIKLPESGTFISGVSNIDPGERLWKPYMQEASKTYTFTKFKEPDEDIKGSEVDLPSCNGMNWTACEKLLKDAEFGINYVLVDSNVPRATVIKTDPTGKAPKYGTISVYVSKGPEENTPSPTPSPSSSKKPN